MIYKNRSMKKIKVVPVIIVVALSSCKKVYQCECKLILNGEDWNPKITNYAIKDTKKNAKALCKSMGFYYGWDNYQACALK